MRRLAIPLTLVSSIAFFACGGGAQKPASSAPAASSSSAPAAESSTIAGLGDGRADDSFGQGGLGISGVGEGAGGQGEGIGLGSVGGLGSAATVASSRRPTSVKMIEVGTEIRGRLPPDVVRRIVRANYPRFRVCYERALKGDETLHGVVAVDFVISAKGEVVGAHAGKGATMPSTKVVDCVVEVFATLAFPEPEGGTVNVHYPIDFQPDE